MNKPLPHDATLTERPITADDLLVLINAGAFAEEERSFELIDGRIFMSPSDGMPHMRGTSGTGEVLNDLLRDAGIRNEWACVPNASIRISDTKVLQPDWAVAKRAATAGDAFFLPEDIALAVEIADKSLRYDEGVKQQWYAEAGIAELWVVRVPSRDLHVRRAPANGAWGEERILTADEMIAPQLAPQAEMAVSALLGEA